MEHILEIVGILAITCIELALICIYHVDGALASVMVGYICYLVTKNKYDPNSTPVQTFIKKLVK